MNVFIVFLYQSISIDSDKKEMFMSSTLSSFRNELYNLTKKILIENLIIDWKETKAIVGTGSSAKKARRIKKFISSSFDRGKDDMVDNTMQLLKSSVESIYSTNSFMKNRV